jgi:hypothetical protein
VQIGGSNSTITQLNLLSSAVGGSYIAATNSFAINVDNSTSVKILPNGNVGIGTTSPGDKLNVEGNILLGTTDKIGWRYSSGNTSYNFITGEDQILTLSGGTWTSSGTQTAVRIKTQQGEKLTIRNDGNVGIGTTTPGAKLEILNVSPSDVFSAQLKLTSSETTGAVDTGGALAFTGNNGIGNSVWAYIRGMKANSIVSNNDSYLSFATRAAGGIPTEKMRITSAGNVGIGTTSPGAKLDVLVGGTNHIQLGASALGSTGDYIGGLYYSSNKLLMESFLVGTGYQDILLSPNGGNVGIGTTSPDEILSIQSTGADTRLQIISDNTRSSTIFFGDPDDRNIGLIEYDNNGDYMRFFSNAAERMRITSIGNVGIGTTSPGTVHGVSYGTTKLHIDGGTDRGQLVVEGDALAAIILSDNGATVNQRVFQTSVNGGDYQIKPLNDNGTSTAQGAAITVLHGGNVGIGTTSPDSTLTVKATVDNRLGGIGWKSTDGTNEWTIDAPNAGNFRIYKGSTAIARFDSSGNFGIGTTSPSQKLEVDGQVLSDGYRLAAMQTAPATRNSTGTLGEIVIDGNHIYVCYATDSWSRVALDTSW